MIYIEPDIGNLFQDPQSTNLAYEEIHPPPKKKILDDAKTLQTIQNIIDLTEKFHQETKRLESPMLPDLWGSHNISGVSSEQALLDNNIPPENLNVAPDNAYTLVANSSILKLNGPEPLFNQRPDFRLVILELVESFKRIINEKTFSNPLPAEALFQAAHLKTWISKTIGIN